MVLRHFAAPGTFSPRRFPHKGNARAGRESFAGVLRRDGLASQSGQFSFRAKKRCGDAHAPPRQTDRFLDQTALFFAVRQGAGPTVRRFLEFGSSASDPTSKARLVTKCCLVAKNMLRVLDLFSGAGGFSMALQSILNVQTVGYCDISPDSRELLADLQRRSLLQKALIFADVKS